MTELNYHHLRYFLAVAREGNLTRAAENLHVTQSAVSVQLKKLEESLGYELFERRGRGLEITPAGRVALDYADSIFSMGDEMLRVLEEEADRRRRTLHVGVLATLSRNFQIGLLAPLLERDDTILHIQSGSVIELIQSLEAHQLDIVLTNSLPAREDSSSWVPHTIDEQPVSLIGRPEPVRNASMEALLREEALVVPTVESGIRLGFDALVERLGIRPHIVAEVDDMAMLRLVTRAHSGLAVIPPIVVKDELEKGTLVEWKQLPELYEPFLAITSTRRAPNRWLQELLDSDIGSTAGPSVDID
jgi:LysR family transcriptional activator of nhaA